MTKTFRKIIQLEMNELSSDLLETYIKQGNLPNFGKIRASWAHASTISEQKYELLEPWIQWVTVHTGKSYQEHGIFHLGSASNLKHDQIWEVLSDHEVESAIIGSMNATRGRTKGGIFFPDPWSPNGVTHPEKLQPLWEFVSNRVQAHAVTNMTLSRAIQGLKSSLDFRISPKIYAKILAQLARQKKDRLKKWMLAGIFDEFLAAIFMDTVKETNFGFYTLFLNSMAHYQHHFWRQSAREMFNPEVSSPDCHPEDDPVGYGLQIYDRILGEILAYSKSDETLIMIVTGLSQIPFTAAENTGGMHYYRLNNHKCFTDHLGLKNLAVYPMMSRDWQIAAQDETALKEAHAALSGIQVEGRPLFTIKRITGNSLFIETAITEGFLQSKPLVKHDGTSLGSVSKWFTSVAVKSGCHSGTGHLWSSYPVFSSRGEAVISLGEVFYIALDALGIKSCRA